MITELNTPNEVLRNLYVYPNYAVLIPPPYTGERSKSFARIENEKNLRDRSLNGGLSKKSRKNLVNSINWLLLASKKKRLFCPKSQKWVSFRLSFVTLTIPDNSENLSDSAIKKKVLRSFLSSLYQMYDLKNYVWKVERHKSGKIHIHMTTDKYIHHSEIKRLWNKVLLNFNLLNDYQKKFSSMTEDDYIKSRQHEKSFDLQKVKKAFLSGQLSNWLEPNSTDVHGVKNIRNLGAYLADYMAKKEEGKDTIAGRVWGCSYSLSKKRSNVLEVVLSQSNGVFDDLYNKNVKNSPICVTDKTTNKEKEIGTFFRWDLRDVGKSLRFGVFEKIRELVFEIRNPATLQFNA